MTAPGSTPPLPDTPFRYRLYGVDLAADFQLRAFLGEVKGQPELWLRRADELTPPDTPPLYESPRSDGDDGPALACYRRGAADLFFFRRVGAFSVGDREIGHRPDPEADPASMVIAFLGTVMSWWLERRDTPAIHASAVCLPAGAAAFLAGNRGGKTGLAAALLGQGGELLSDDIVPLKVTPEGVQAHPGYPQMRMWPDLAAHFLGDAEGLPLVHPKLDKRRVPVRAGGLGRFHDAPAPLRALYLPGRNDEPGAGLSFSAVPPVSAVLELIRNSFTPGLVRAFGLEGPRLGKLAAVAERVPMFRLTYPSGLDRLPEVADAVRQHMESLAK